jgi:hypothetical protein
VPSFLENQDDIECGASPVPASTISIGRNPIFLPPASGAPSITTAWPLPVSATNAIPASLPIHLTVHSILISLLDDGFYRNHGVVGFSVLCCCAASFSCLDFTILALNNDKYRF